MHGIATMPVAVRSAKGCVSRRAGLGGHNVRGFHAVIHGNADWLNHPLGPTIEG